MISLWQNPGGEIDWFREVYPDYRASYLWIGPDTVEIRIYSFKQKPHLWLDQHGRWNEVEEAEWCPPSKVISREEAERMQVTELEPGIHILDYNMDRCKACKTPGWFKERVTTKCQGWVCDSKRSQ